MEIGRQFTTSTGICTVISYESSTKVGVMFENGFTTTAEAGNLRKGNVKNFYHPSVFGVGYVGRGEYGTRLAGKSHPTYTRWQHVLRRCYSDRYLKRHPSYQGCYVNDFWHNYQNFGEWFTNLVYKQDGWDIDKDVLLKGNKEYSDKHCILLPPEINISITNRALDRGKCVVGVGYNSKYNNYYAQISKGEQGHVSLGTFKSEIEAFRAYKAEKELYLRGLADKWADHIDPRAYEALIKYKVEITD